MQENDLARNPRVTWEGCSVLLDINNGDRLVFARLSQSATLKIGDSICSLEPVIGRPFGSVFEVQHGTDGPCLALLKQEHDFAEKEECDVKDGCRDNRNLNDDNTAQSLTSDDIGDMRKQGASGQQIIEALIANSTTFENKTLFSQEKYRLKKQKKYAPKVLLRRPFARSVCEAYFKKHPDKIGYLRVDTLSLLLTLANVGAYSDVLVVDTVGGILIGAVAERLGGTGYVCGTYFGNTSYPSDIVKIFNFSSDVCQRIVVCAASDLSGERGKISDGQDAISGNTVPSPDYENGSPGPITRIQPPRPIKSGEKVSEEVIGSWKRNGFSSLIIASPEMDIWKTVTRLLPLLSPSAPFVVYHRFLQPLATCMHKLQETKMAVGLQINEPWLREYQVLSSRTHPCMKMSSAGGFVLSGIHISLSI